MRLWSLHPCVLDRAALVSCWREGLLAQAVLAGKTKGYRNHPQLTRFASCERPLPALASYLEGLRSEATLRGYRFDPTRIAAEPDSAVRISVTDGQLDLELEHLRAKVVTRQPEWEPRLTRTAHPIFSVVPGAAEHWERLSP